MDYIEGMSFVEKMRTYEKELEGIKCQITAYKAAIFANERAKEKGQASRLKAAQANEAEIMIPQLQDEMNKVKSEIELFVYESNDRSSLGPDKKRMAQLGIK